MSQSTTKFSKNVDTGSLHLGANLPKEFQKHGMVPAAGTLEIQIEGEPKARPVTYIMGSEKKGWSVCCKGTGKFPTDGEYTVITAE